MPFAIVRAEAEASRVRLLAAWVHVPVKSLDVEYWVTEAGPEHYQEHLPGFRDWIGELRT